MSDTITINRELFKKQLTKAYTRGQQDLRNAIANIQNLVRLKEDLSNFVFDMDSLFTERQLQMENIGSRPNLPGDGDTEFDMLKISL